MVTHTIKYGKTTISKATNANNISTVRFISYEIPSPWHANPHLTNEGAANSVAHEFTAVNL